MQVASVYDMFHRMEKKTGIKITPHMLRRYFADARWDSGWPLELVGRFSWTSTFRYNDQISEFNG